MFFVPCIVLVIASCKQTILGQFLSRSCVRVVSVGPFCVTQCDYSLGKYGVQRGFQRLLLCCIGQTDDVGCTRDFKSQVVAVCVCKTETIVPSVLGNDSSNQALMSCSRPLPHLGVFMRRSFLDKQTVRQSLQYAFLA